MDGCAGAGPSKNLNVLSAEALRFHEVVEELYRQPGILPWSVDAETGRFLYSLARLAQPDLAVEVGTYHGISTLWLARALEDNGKGQLISLDLFEDPPIEDVQRTIEQARLAGRVQLVRGPSTTIGAEACRRAGQPIDLLFIDGDHRVEACGADFETLGALVRMGGLVVLHDIYPERSGRDGPRYVLNFLAETHSQRNKWQVIELPTPAHAPYGLAILQRLAEGPTRVLPRPVYWLYQLCTLFRFWLRGKRQA